MPLVLPGSQVPPTMNTYGSHPSSSCMCTTVILLMAKGSSVAVVSTWGSCCRGTRWLNLFCTIVVCRIQCCLSAFSNHYFVDQKEGSRLRDHNQLSIRSIWYYPVVGQCLYWLSMWHLSEYPGSSFLENSVEVSETYEPSQRYSLTSRTPILNEQLTSWSSILQIVRSKSTKWIFTADWEGAAP